MRRDQHSKTCVH